MRINPLKLPTASVFKRLQNAPCARAQDVADRSRTQPVVVLDTNVVLDIWFWHDAHARALHDALADGALRATINVPCLAEIAEVISRTCFALSVEKQCALLEALLSCAIVVEDALDPAPVRCLDTDDQKWLDLAAACRADILVTKDKLVRKAARKKRFAALGIRVMQPKEFEAAG